MRRTIWCNHYEAPANHEQCAAGVPYVQFKGKPFDQWPCFCKPGQSPPGGCDKAQFPAPEELEAGEKAHAERFEKVMKARAAIVAHLGGPWRKGMPGAAGVIDCPACGQAQSLRFSRAGCNGHVHAHCVTADCVSWME